MPTKIVTNQLYNEYFNPEAQNLDWKTFASSKKILVSDPTVLDFSIQEEKGWGPVALKVAGFAVEMGVFFALSVLTSNRKSLWSQKSNLLNAAKEVIKNVDVIKTAKTAFFRLSVYELTRYVLQRLIMIPFYPAQSNIVKRSMPPIQNKSLDRDRKGLFSVSQYGYIVRHVALMKNGVQYSGLLIGHVTTITNGKWVLQATANCEPVECSATDFARNYLQSGYNTLLINGPGVGRSQGQAHPETMGDAQHVGLCFIETALRAQKIVIAGRSLGGAAASLAILKHDFKKEGIQYLALRQMTFDRASNIAGEMIGGRFYPLKWTITRIVQWCGLEMDSIAASRKLTELNIKEVIVQATNKTITAEELPTTNDFQTDGLIIAKASLGHGLVSESLTENKEFICFQHASHMAQYTTSIPAGRLNEWLPD